MVIVKPISACARQFRPHLPNLFASSGQHQLAVKVSLQACEYVGGLQRTQSPHDPGMKFCSLAICEGSPAGCMLQ
eukprot:5469011-Karenia_brevis.AAC.1